MQICAYFVPGRPVGQGSMRSLGKGRMTHNNPHLKAWRQAVGWAFKAAGPGEPTAADVRVTLHFAVHPRRKGDAPDLDKLVRAVLDALTGLAYLDDKQVVEILARRTLVPEADEGARIAVAHDPTTDPRLLVNIL